jgi:basic membrane protein A
MFKKILSLVLAVVMVAALVACSDMDSKEAKMTESPLPEVELKKDFDVPADFKIGFILLHDEASTYDLNFINAVKKVQETLGLTDDQIIYKKGIPESNVCYETACDLADAGCKIIFADSFGHESHLLEAAKKYPEIEFCHATGTQAHTAGLDNFHNAFASIYEGRYLAGVAAGLKLNELKADGKLKGDAPKMGYVGAFTFAEVISGYTSFYLGAKSVCPDVTMEVQFTGSWYDENAEKNAATALINNGCDLISQHADSMGAPTACEENKIPNVSYNGSTHEACPSTFIVSSRIDWSPYYLYIIKSYCKGEKIAADWCGGAEQGSVVLTGINENAAAEGTLAKLQEVAAKLKNGEIKVFDTNNFTVDGKKLDSYKADVDTDAAFEKDTEVIKDGYFHESEYRAAPYFDIQIDGIKLLNTNFG